MSKTYDPSMVTITIGVTAIDDWDEVKVAFDEEGWTFTSGTQGEATRTKNMNKLGTIIITVPQTSSDNDILSNWVFSGLVVPINITDSNGTSRAQMLTGTVVKLADQDFAKESGSREWTIKGKLTVAPTLGFVGGSLSDVAVQTY